MWEHAVVSRTVDTLQRIQWICPRNVPIPEYTSLHDACVLMGQQGWELVTVTTRPDGNWGGAICVVHDLFFKRLAQAR